MLPPRSFIVTIFPRTKNYQCSHPNHESFKSWANWRRSGFIGALDQLLPVWTENSSERPFIKSLRYRRDNEEILLDLEAPSIDLLDRLQQQFANQGISAELLSATEEGKGVRGRVKLTGVQ